MAGVKIRTKVAATAKKGEVIEIKTLATHSMESGQRKDRKGKKIPRNILNRFVATYNGKEVFASDWHPAISANPYLVFYLKVENSGTLEMSWREDGGKIYKSSKKITVN